MNPDVSPLQPLWDLTIRAVGMEVLASPAWLLTCVMAGVYVPGVLFSVVDVCLSRRLTLAACLAVHWRAMKLYASIYLLGMALLLSLPLPPLLAVPAPAPSTWEFLRDLALYFLVGDMASYGWHRLEHAHRLYARKIHCIHHFDKPPLSIWTAMVVHPVEGMTVFFFFHLYGIVMPIHPLTFSVAAFALTSVTMITHCGYRLPVYDWFFATSRGHDLHHSRREPVNVSVVLTICDRLFGTYRATAHGTDA